MSIVMQENVTITQHAIAFQSDGEIDGTKSVKKHLSGKSFSSDRDVKTSAENWLNEQERDFYQVELYKLVLLSDKCFNRFDDYMKK
ncbi:hypothetical protein AVEN_205687-1 [Araneus ventricosus]|uniref:Uncharacterized protein n=1 Tax=Araneus ventricosus TaxID=182803 RepID=A0A4Y2KQV5_ARAVE|nr:hypothetical protein AVEN_205687-1 [Araneus ventricosus]